MPIRLHLSIPGLSIVALGLVGCATVDTVPPIRDGDSPIAYYVRPVFDDASRYDVGVAIDRLSGDSIDYVLPEWAPGQYGAGLHRTLIEGFSARDGRGRSLSSRRLSRTSYRIYHWGQRYITLSYQVVPDDPAEPLAFQTQLDERKGYALGAGVFGFVRGFERVPLTVSFDLPGSWLAYSSLRPLGPNRFAADTYAELPGALFILGEGIRGFRVFVEGRPHQVAIQGAARGFDTDSLLSVVRETIETGVRFYGPPPYRRYLFSFLFVPPGASGIGSTGQAAGSAYFLPQLGGDRIREAGLGTLLLHQYLHAWFPGTFGPGALRKPDYLTIPSVADLWLVEGASEYYARLLPARYGRAGRYAFYQAMGPLLTLWHQLDGSPQIDIGSLVDSMVETPVDREIRRRIVGGTLAAFLLDLTIREETRGLRGLDQIMYYFQKWTPAEGYDERGIWSSVASALDIPRSTLEPITERGRMSIEAGFARAGLRVVERQERRRSLGARLEADAEGRFRVTGVESGGTADAAGLREGDRLLKINATPVNPTDQVATGYALETYVRAPPPGTPITFEIVRDGAVRSLSGTVREHATVRLEIEEDPAATPSAMVVRGSLFRPTGPPTDSP